MLESMETLVALAECGTMRRTALKLHISQSAVSKRIDNLESILARRLIEPRGRRVELTPEARRFVDKLRPLLAELRQLFLMEESGTHGRIELDLSVSVLIAGGSKALAHVQSTLLKLELKVNAHHASVAVERVRSGETMLALVQGEASSAPDLAALPVLRQTIVIIPSGLGKLRLPRRGGVLRVIAIEEHTEAWSFIHTGLRTGLPEWGFNIEVGDRLQSFSAIAEMARAGFGHGLVPSGVANALGIQPKQVLLLPSPGIHVPVSLVGRRSTLARPLVQTFYQALLATVRGQGRAEASFQG